MTGEVDPQSRKTGEGGEVVEFAPEVVLKKGEM
jgi:hypothetical protein